MSGEFNKASGDWLTIRRHVAETVAAKRTEIERDGLAIERTQFIRGEIAALNAFIEHFDPTPLPDAKDDSHYG